MNKIEVVSKSKILNELNDKVKIVVDNNTLNITFNADIDESIMLVNNIYNRINIVIEAMVHINILEIKNESNISAKYNYVLNDGSKLIINKFYYMHDYEETIDVNLEGYESNVLCNLSMISFGHQKYVVNINHHHKKTISNVYNHGVTFGDGKLELLVNGRVNNGMSDSVLMQDNKIMNMGNGNSIIKPNLFIDENMVEARHGASIGRFNEEELFYLAARGIPETEGYRLLMKGFLLGTLHISDDVRIKLNDIIEKLGR